MPTKTYASAEKAWQALTDVEILDDGKDLPCAVIRVKGVGKLRIRMVSEWDYFESFVPMRNKFVTHYANRLLASENVTDDQTIIERLKAFQNEISASVESANPDALTYLFSERAARAELFAGLKKMRVIPWWVSWERWQRWVTVVNTMTIFAFMWLFNVDGVKKNAKLLVDRISQVLTTNLPTESMIFQDLDSFKKVWERGRAADPWLAANSRN